MNPKYNESPFHYARRQTREVKAGDVGIGGNNPIRVQSMITANTRDTEASVAQIKALWEVGSEIVRVTVPSQADADNLPEIRKEMKRQKIQVPLVADIHFTPTVALKCVEWVEKVRINPGNFADKKKFDTFEYTDAEYNLELERIEEVFTPLVLRAKELGVSMRIGTNHGSLSDRIMNRYGDTPQGMVESALEFIRIAERNSYRDIVVSMKSSNPQTMVQAYRLLVSRFYELNMDYPLHLGVTEAGDGQDGRIKSSAGIGSLLEDGLGDTIRVSLTEDPIEEIPVAKRLVAKYNELFLKGQADKLKVNQNGNFLEFRDPFAYSRFYSKETSLSTLNLGDNSPVRVETPFILGTLPEDLLSLSATARKTFRDIEIIKFNVNSEWELLELIAVKKRGSIGFPISVRLGDDLLSNWESFVEEFFAFQKLILPISYFENLRKLDLPELESFLDYLALYTKEGRSVELSFSEDNLNSVPLWLADIQKRNLKQVLFSLQTLSTVLYRKLAFLLKDVDFPILLAGEFTDFESALYDCSVHMGGLLLDGIGDVLRIDFAKPLDVSDSAAHLSFHLAYDILQATRLRLSKTEYISCPSCGRTMFDLQTTTAKIKAKTGHLRGVKIAVMGCIVNGPGEMADADFGYVGAGVGKVHLYKGKEIVLKGVSETEADSKLIDLIKENGMWIEPET